MMKKQGYLRWLIVLFWLWSLLGGGFFGARPAAAGQAMHTLAPAPPSPRKAKALRADARAECRDRLPPLRQWIESWERRSGLAGDLGELSRQGRRARRASWLPRVMLSGEQRQQYHRGRALKTGESLDRDEKRGRTRVFRGRLSWDLSALLDPPGATSRLSLRQRLLQEGERTRLEIAQRYAELRALSRRNCQAGLEEKELQRGILLAAMLEAQTGLRIRWAWRKRSEGAPGPAGAGF